ncbi:unnamed protein product [Clonostachys rhizophaga]|uniref:Uncharacterized protein n=1 Tax=Clonostachys rhizophaga TaxID=160324 RepID=A0A9N9YSN3_9HYPO|nr:unnamed protein product [Clonostachys rhizophaga]
METAPGDIPMGVDSDDAAEDVADHQENLGPDPALVALLEGFKGPNTSVQVLTTDGSSLPVMDVEGAKASLIFIPDPIEKEKVMDFTNIRLACPIPAEQIQNRWLNSMVPIPGHVMQTRPNNITFLLHQMLKSYAGTAIRGRGILPFVHPLQTADPSQTADDGWCEPLSTCLSTVRVLDNPILGPDQRTADLIREKMCTIQNEYLSCKDEMKVLAAFQAYLTYTLTLFFYVNQDRDDYLAKAMAILQALARRVTMQGLVTPTRAPNCRHIWEEWVAGEAKRRTILVMYLFDALLAVRDRLPIYSMVELQNLPAPGPKSLWQETVRSDWKTAYTAYETHWDNGSYLRIIELWPSSPTFSRDDAETRRNRVDLWLEDIDEFGTFFYAYMASAQTVCI